MNVDVTHHTTHARQPGNQQRARYRYTPRSRQEKILHWLCGGQHAVGIPLLITGRDLARRACGTESASDITAILDQLEAGGWIAVVTHPRTREITILKLLPEQQSFIDQDCSRSIMIDHDRSGTVTCIEERACAHASTFSLEEDLSLEEEDARVKQAQSGSENAHNEEHDPRIDQLVAAGVKTSALAREIIHAQRQQPLWTIGAFLSDLQLARSIDGIREPLGYAVTVWRNGDRLFPTYTVQPARDTARIPQTSATPDQEDTHDVPTAPQPATPDHGHRPRSYTGARHRGRSGAGGGATRPAAAAVDYAALLADVSEFPDDFIPDPRL